VKLAILGGSFNPVHIGHLFLADSVATGLGYDRVILVPAFQSPFKAGAEGASPQDRMEMLAASIAADPRLTIDDCEIRREGVSYTIDTLKDIIARYLPTGKPGLILGDDLASTFHNWRSPGEIAELAEIIIARRVLDTPLSPKGEGSEWNHGSPAGSPAGGDEYACKEDSRAREGPGTFPYPYRALDNEIINVSSRQVREKIGRFDAWRYLVPSGARNIIEDRGLYGFSGPGIRQSFRTGESVSGGESAPAVLFGDSRGLTETIVRLENDVRSILSPGRFMHSRNTALQVWDLCRRFGIDPQKGYLAGIAHDMCKSLGEKELFRLARADGGSISKLEQRKPGLLHARAAAVQLKRKYGIGDRDVLDAIRYHTTGTRDMNDLAKIVYIADKIEVGRPGIEASLRELKESADLETLFAAVLNNTVAFLRSRELDISYGTKRLLSAMHKRNSL